MIQNIEDKKSDVGGLEIMQMFKMEREGVKEAWVTLSSYSPHIFCWYYSYLVVPVLKNRRKWEMKLLFCDWVEFNWLLERQTDRMTEAVKQCMLKCTTIITTLKPDEIQTEEGYAAMPLHIWIMRSGVILSYSHLCVWWWWGAKKK